MPTDVDQDINSIAQEKGAAAAYHAVDLRLPKNKIPVKLIESHTPNIENILNTHRSNREKFDFLLMSRESQTGVQKKESEPSRKSFAIGMPPGSHKMHYCELGLFDGIKEAWENHWNLWTCPEDWWFMVHCRIAKAIDKAAKRNNKGIHEHFVSHEGKEMILIQVPSYTIYDIDYDMLFGAFSSELERRIKVPQFARSMQSDFSTTTPPQ